MTSQNTGRFRQILAPVASATAAAALLAACASAPMKNPALEDARALYSQAAADADAARSAPLELRRAQQALAQAEATLAAGGDTDSVNHQAYLARQRAATALQTAEIARADRAVTAAGEERNRILMTARSSEAQQARGQAEQARGQAEQARALADKERLEAEQARTQAGQARQDAEAQLAAAKAAQAKVAKLQAEMAALQAKQTDRGMVLTLGDVLFDTGRAELKSGAFATLDRLATFLRENPERTLKIEGHTDSVGSDSFNLDLSQRRADAVRGALVDRGLDGSRVDTEGLGKSRPVASNGSAEGRQRNRRVEIVIANAG